MRKRAFSGKRERRLSRRLRVWSERLALGSVLLVLLGVGGVVWAEGGARLLGAGFALAGLFGLGLHLRLLWQTREARLRLQRAAERRVALQASRRERAEQERLRRQTEQETRAHAAERLEQARRAQQVAAQALQEQADQRNARERRVEQEALRIAALSDAELHPEIAALLTRRGYRPELADNEYPGDFLLRSEAGFAVLRCVPAGQKAGRSDVEALEAWRVQAEAERAYLVATAGFLPSAIDRLANLPLTLVEPHLLAHWRQE